jgi:hypothetical protein
MASNATFYEQARDLGEVVWRGLHYRLFYEPERQCTICVLVPGQNLAPSTNG